MLHPPMQALSKVNCDHSRNLGLTGRASAALPCTESIALSEASYACLSYAGYRDTSPPPSILFFFFEGAGHSYIELDAVRV